MKKENQYFKIEIPSYKFSKGKPNFKKISQKIIELLRKEFNGKRIVLRLLGSEEHPNKKKDDLIKTIFELGHDRYDKKRVGDRYENIDNLKIDFFALDFMVGNKREEECIYWALDSFYDWPLKDRDKPIKIDIGIVYDINFLKVVEHRYVGRENEIKRDGFIFKKSKDKSKAILGLICIE